MLRWFYEFGGICILWKEPNLEFLNTIVGTLGKNGLWQVRVSWTTPTLTRFWSNSTGFNGVVGINRMCIFMVGVLWLMYFSPLMVCCLCIRIFQNRSSSYINFTEIAWSTSCTYNCRMYFVKRKRMPIIGKIVCAIDRILEVTWPAPELACHSGNLYAILNFDCFNFLVSTHSKLVTPNLQQQWYSIFYCPLTMCCSYTLIWVRLILNVFVSFANSN